MKTERLILTEVSPDDSAFILELVNTPVWEEFLGDKNIKDLEAAARYIDKFIHQPGYRYWVVRLPEGNVPIGGITLIQRDYLDHPDIGFAFLPAYLKKGYAYEAAAAVMNNRNVISEYSYILGTTHPGNQNSIHLLEKLGLHYEKVIHVDGNPLNLYLKATGFNKPATMNYNIESVAPADYPEVVELWEASVRATHHFLSEADIQFFKPLILNEFLSAVTLRCIREEGILMGFMGVADGKLEMLFVHPDAMGKGIGKHLIHYGMAELGVVAVDVNEDNPNAAGFYRHLGFKVEKRSPLDAMGKPFPILHMVKED